MSLQRPALMFAMLSAACLIAALGAHKPLTALMSLHMLVQIPLLVLVGVFAERAIWLRCPVESRAQNWPYRFTSRSAAQSTDQQRWSYNEYGIPGLLLVSLVGAAWMIPKALDDALTDWRVAAFKYVGLPVCGWVLGSSLRQAPLVVKLFFLGNFCWMSAIVGLTFLDQPTRLCNAYLLSDQDWAGRGLLALAVLLPLGWLMAHTKLIRCVCTDSIPSEQ